MADPKNNKQSKAVEVKKDAALPAVSVLDDMFQQDAALGKENIHGEDLAIPFFSLLQSNSPQCKKTEGAYIKGAEEGMIMNTVTRELFAGTEGIFVVPCYYERVAIEWKPNRGGLVAIYRGEERDAKVGQASRVQNEEGKSIDRMPNGNELSVTAQHYVLRLKADGTWEPGLLSMSSTQLKKSRRWNALMSNIQLKTAAGASFNPPAFSHVYKVTSAAESRDKNSWWGWNIETHDRVSSKDLYEAAKAFYASCSKGETRVSEAATESAAKGGALNDEIPF